MVETTDAIEAVYEILEVPGIDAVFIGPSDLAVSMGVDPSRAFENADHEKLVRQVLSACRRRGIMAGLFCGGAGHGTHPRGAGLQHPSPSTAPPPHPAAA